MNLSRIEQEELWLRNHPLDLRDLRIIQAIPDGTSSILVVGCGQGRISTHLIQAGYRVVATDIDRRGQEFLDILDIDLALKLKFESDVVICSQVLEHIPEYSKALDNLEKLARNRIIITVPRGRGYYDPSHVNFWEDRDHALGVFGRMGLCQVQEIIAKPSDRVRGQSMFLITVDKR